MRRFRRIVRQQHEIHVARGDLSFRQYARLQPAEQSGPVVPAEENDRELIDLASLNERECLERFVERAEAAGEDNEGARVLDEHRFPNEEVSEVHERVDVGVRALLEGQLDVAADRTTPTFLRALVRRLHDARSRPGDDGEAGEGEQARRLLGREILWVVRRGARRAEDRDTAPDDPQY